MSTPLKLHEDRLFPAEPGIRALARELYADVADLPIISPHGHTDPAWFAHDEPFGNATELLLHPDHYVFRMLYSQGIALEDLGIDSLGLVESIFAIEEEFDIQIPFNANEPSESDFDITNVGAIVAGIRKLVAEQTS